MQLWSFCRPAKSDNSMTVLYIAYYVTQWFPCHSLYFFKPSLVLDCREKKIFQLFPCHFHSLALKIITCHFSCRHHSASPLCEIILVSYSCYLMTLLSLVQVLYGKVSVRSYDLLDNKLTTCPILPHFDPPLAPFQTTSLRRTVFRASAEYTENSGPCLLTPVQENLHQINAVEGPAAFLDILAPPYNVDDGRDCHYYRVLQTLEEGRTAEQQGDEEKKEKVTWMLEIPEPEDFWCGPEPYPGPAVSV